MFAAAVLRRKFRTLTRLVSLLRAGYPVDPAVLAKDYVCEKDLRPWWGNFSGPCCIPKPKN